MRSDNITDPAPIPNLERDPRVLFAAERTLLAWIRTGLALMGFGFVVARFGLFLRQVAATRDITAAPAPGTTGFSLWLGLSLVIIGVAVNLIAARQHFRVIGRLNRGESLFPAPPSTGVYIAALLALVGIVITGYLFIVGQ